MYKSIEFFGSLCALLFLGTLVASAVIGDWWIFGCGSMVALAVGSMLMKEEKQMIRDERDRRELLELRKKQQKQG